MALLSTIAQASISGGETFTQGNVTENPNFADISGSANIAITNGTGSGQAQHTISVLVAATTSGVSLDLHAVPALGGGLDGAARVFSAIKAWKIENMDPTNTVAVGAATSNAWTGINGTTNIAKTIQVGGWIAECEPVTGQIVTATNSVILCTAGAGTVSTKITVVGTGT